MGIPLKHFKSITSMKINEDITSEFSIIIIALHQ